MNAAIWQRYQAGERDFSGANLLEADLNQVNLNGALLNEAILGKARMRGARMRGVNLSKAKLFEVDLRPHFESVADLSYAFMNGADLSYAKLNGAILYKAKLRGAKLHKAELGRWAFNGFHITNLTEADLTEADLSYADLSYADFSRAILRKANLSGADLSSTNLSDADLDGAIMPTEQAEVLETKVLEIANIEDVHNQAVEAKSVKIWNNLRFRSASEVKIAQALDKAGVLFFPNCKARLTTPEGRQNREPDFLVCYNGKWGILEVDGEPWHPPSRTVHDHDRDRLFRTHGIRIVEHYDANRCFEQADTVVQEFLQILNNA